MCQLQLVREEVSSEGGFDDMLSAPSEPVSQLRNMDFASMKMHDQAHAFPCREQYASAVTSQGFPGTIALVQATWRVSIAECGREMQQNCGMW